MAEGLLDGLKGKYVLISTSDEGILGYAAKIISSDEHFIKISNFYTFDKTSGNRQGNYRSYYYIKTNFGKLGRREFEKFEEMLERHPETKLIPKKAITGIERLVARS